MSARSTTLPSTLTRTLRAAVLVLAGAGAALAVSTGVAHADTIHGPYNLTTSQCATCHRAHTGQARMLLDTTASAALKSPTTTLCLTCHNGTGANPDLASEYATATPNNAATRSFFQHEVTVVTTHTLGSDDEFSGVLNRHSECTDCHNPHRGGTQNSVSSPVGQPWTASQRILGTSGVQVTNGSPRTYTFLSGTSTSMTAEYQLCLKCHSGYTKLLPDIPGEPSKNMLDAGVEFDPANNSYHPVEAAGRNKTPAMAASLAGTSRFKLWNFTTSSTIRCTSCHSSDIANPATSGVTAGASLPNHTSSYRGILVQKYEDRAFNVKDAAFNEANFALCFLCHADSPFTSSDRSATNFSLHQLHVSSIGGSGSTGGTIDTPGAGVGNALCAECHFRPHSTATDTAQHNGLVAFAPNVLGTATTPTPTWTSATPGTGSCTLTCHGVRHSGEDYIPSGKP